MIILNPNTFIYKSKRISDLSMTQSLMNYPANINSEDTVARKQKKIAKDSYRTKSSRPLVDALEFDI